MPACVQPSEIGDLERASSHSAFTLVSPLFTGYQTSPYYRARGAWMRPKQVAAFSPSRECRTRHASSCSYLIIAAETMESAPLQDGTRAGSDAKSRVDTERQNVQVPWLGMLGSASECRSPPRAALYEMYEDKKCKSLLEPAVEPRASRVRAYCTRSARKASPSLLLAILSANNK